MSWDEYEYGERKPKRSALLDDECVKCGSFDNTYRFHDYCDLSDVEHIHYSCYSCGYAWSGKTVEQMRDESGYFNKFTSAGIYKMGSWSDWEAYDDEIIPDDDYEPSLSKHSPIVSER